MAAARLEMDPAKREQMYIDIQKMAKADVNWIDLYYSPFINVSRKNVENFYQNPLGRFFWRIPSRTDAAARSDHTIDHARRTIRAGISRSAKWLSSDAAVRHVAGEPAAERHAADRAIGAALDLQGPVSGAGASMERRHGSVQTSAPRGCRGVISPLPRKPSKKPWKTPLVSTISNDASSSSL